MPSGSFRRRGSLTQRSPRAGIAAVSSGHVTPASGCGAGVGRGRTSEGAGASDASGFTVGVSSHRYSVPPVNRSRWRPCRSISR